ncbi:MAG: hypothetical protein R6X31_02055 [Anaerolineae bacterium]
MAEKSRRSADREIRLSETQMKQPGMNGMAPVEAAPDSPSSEGPQLADEYRYVVADLKRIAAIAAAMLVVLIVLALVLP